VGRRGRQKAFLQLWLPEDGSLKKAAPCNDSLSALAVSDDGRFIAVGTMFSGSVLVYIAFSLQVQILVSIIFNNFYRIILK
jgi:prolactin regulatory element-binding protein